MVVLSSSLSSRIMVVCCNTAAVFCENSAEEFIKNEILLQIVILENCSFPTVKSD
jgi:hypothetical protein